MDKYSLITRNLQEVIGQDELKKLVKSKKEISVYWGTMPTGSISIAYFFPMLKVADFLKAGMKVKILLADLHGALDSVPWEVLEHRHKYYEEAVKTILKSIGVDLKRLEFVKGSELQLNKEYLHDLLKLSTYTSVGMAKKSASEVVKLGDNPKLSGLIYPLMQAVDEQYLGVDLQMGGTDQRKIMVLARENLPKIGYDRRIELMFPLIPSLIGGKMSSSDEGGKIDVLDDEETVKKKINKADCVEGDPNNGLMAFLKHVIMIMKEDDKEKFKVERPEKFGGNVSYASYEEIEKDFVAKKLHPMDLKIALAGEISKLLGKMDRKKLEKLVGKAYGE